MAGGGHYYSFGENPDDPSKWHRYDDEVISTFGATPSELAYECYGGPVDGNGSTGSINRTANGLVLFYRKKNNIVGDSGSFQASSLSDVRAVPTPAGQRLVNGFDAYRAEVIASNAEHSHLTYMTDTRIANFVRRAMKQDLLTSTELSRSEDKTPSAAAAAATEDVGGDASATKRNAFIFPSLISSRLSCIVGTDCMCRAGYQCFV